MIQRYRYIITFSLLFSYLFLGFAGTLETLAIIGIGTNPEYITKSANTPPSTFKVFWTQYKHIPSTVKISVPSPAVISTPEVARICLQRITIIQIDIFDLIDPFFSDYSSRAPPQA